MEPIKVHPIPLRIHRVGERTTGPSRSKFGAQPSLIPRPSTVEQLHFSNMVGSGNEISARHYH